MLRSVFTNTLKIKRYLYTRKTPHSSVNQISSNLNVLEPSQNKTKQTGNTQKKQANKLFIKSVTPEEESRPPSKGQGLDTGFMVTSYVIPEAKLFGSFNPNSVLI